MNQFYIHFNEEELGPFSIIELKTLKITRKTMTWYEGIEEWKPAEEIAELQSLFPPKMPPSLAAKEAIKPPPIVKETIKFKQEEVIQQSKQQAHAYITQQQPKKKSGGVGKYLLLLLVGIGSFIAYFAIQDMGRRSSDSLGFDGSATNANTYEQNVMTMEEQERNNPIRFLSTSFEYRDNILGNKTVLNGTITNSAAKATFKDVVVEVKFYSGTKSLISTINYTIYDYFPAGMTKGFNLRIKHPDGTEKVGLSIVNAVPQ